MERLPGDSGTHRRRFIGTAENDLQTPKNNYKNNADKQPKNKSRKNNYRHTKKKEPTTQ
jgi:hypothetical protein